MNNQETMPADNLQLVKKKAKHVFLVFLSICYISLIAIFFIPVMAFLSWATGTTIGISLALIPVALFIPLCIGAHLSQYYDTDFIQQALNPGKFFALGIVYIISVLVISIILHLAIMPTVFLVSVTQAVGHAMNLSLFPYAATASIIIMMSICGLLILGRAIYQFVNDCGYFLASLGDKYILQRCMGKSCLKSG